MACSSPRRRACNGRRGCGQRGCECIDGWKGRRRRKPRDRCGTGSRFAGRRQYRRTCCRRPSGHRLVGNELQDVVECRHVEAGGRLNHLRLHHVSWWHRRFGRQSRKGGLAERFNRACARHRSRGGPFYGHPRYGVGVPAYRARHGGTGFSLGHTEPAVAVRADKLNRHREKCNGGGGLFRLISGYSKVTITASAWRRVLPAKQNRGGGPSGYPRAACVTFAWQASYSLGIIDGPAFSAGRMRASYPRN